MQERVDKGMSIKEYCKHIRICGNTYFYWQRRVREAACEQLGITSFTEIRVAEPAKEFVAVEPAELGQLRVEVGGIQLTADSSYPADQLAVLLRELARPC
jgi:hypothetical protein